MKSVNMKILSNTFVNSVTANELKILSTTTYVLGCLLRTQPYLLVLFYRSKLLFSNCLGIAVVLTLNMQLCMASLNISQNGPKITIPVKITYIS